MKKIKSANLALLGILLTISSCKSEYKLQLESPKQLQVSEKLSVSVTEKNNQPIDSTWYYLDGQKLAAASAIDISDKKLGKHAVSATIFYGEEQKKLTNTIVFLAAKAPQIYTYEIVNEYPHDENAFTQGLEYYDGFLYESTGQRGSSSLRKVALETGKVLQKIDLEDKYFGEGMTIFNNKIYMLTWQGNKGFVFNLDTFKLEKEFPYGQSKEGWGLTHNNEQLIKTDGTDRVWFLDPKTLEEKSHIEVYTIDRNTDKLNEIEYINGKIYANIWQRNSIVIIDPITGTIEGIADLSGLQSKVGKSGDDHVLNGIAYDEEKDRLFVTGKDWNTLFEIKLLKKQ